MIQHILLLESKPETTAEEMQEVLMKARAFYSRFVRGTYHHYTGI